MVPICFFEEVQTFLAQFDGAWHVCILTEEREYLDINHMRT